MKGVPLVAQQHQEPKNKNTRSISSLGRRSCPLHADRCCCEYTYEGEGYPTIHVFPTVAACEQWKEQSTEWTTCDQKTLDRLVFDIIENREAASAAMFDHDDWWTDNNEKNSLYEVEDPWTWDGTADGLRSMPHSSEVISSFTGIEAGPWDGDILFHDEHDQ